MKASKFSKSPVRLTYEKQRKHKLLLSEIKWESSTTNSMEIKIIIKEFCETLCSLKFENLDDKIDQFVINKRHSCQNPQKKRQYE